MKKYFIHLFIVFFFFQCKKEETVQDSPQSSSIPTDYTKPCQLSSFSSGMETTRFNYVKNSEGKIIEKIANYYIPANQGSVKTNFEYNAQGQLIKTSHYVLLPSPADGGYNTYEYDAQARMIKKVTLTSTDGFILTQFLEYDDANRVKTIRQKVDNTDAPIYINLIYDTDGDLIRIDWCDVGNNQCIAVESYEYDKTKPFYKIPETFIISPLVDISHGTHFLKKKNVYNNQGVIVGSNIFQIEEANTDGYPIRLSTYPEGNQNLKVTYTYDYDCK